MKSTTASSAPRVGDGDDDDDDDDDDDHADEGQCEAGTIDHRYVLPPGADASLDWGLRGHQNADGTPKIVERVLAVPSELAGLRLDHFIKTQIGRLSRTKIQHVIATQLARVFDGGRGLGNLTLKPATMVADGDRFVIRRPARREPPCPRTLTVLHEDRRVFVIDKPALLPVHASAKFYFNTLTRVMAERWPDEPELQICHRLDRETSGCLVVARDRDAATVIKGAFATKHLVTKEYLAIVDGVPPWTEDTLLDIPLRLSQPGDATALPHVRMIPRTADEDPRARPLSPWLAAMTRVRVEAATATRALVRCTLLTGRQHQIRAHLAARGFPIVGDKLYGHGDTAFMQYCDLGLTPELAALFGLPRHALHAARIRFPHPDGGFVTAEAPLPHELAALLM